MLHFLQPWQWVLVLFFATSFIVVAWVLPFAFICRKAGFSPWLTLLNCIPFGTMVLVFLLAFSEWRKNPGTRSTATVLEIVHSPKPIPVRQAIPKASY